MSSGNWTARAAAIACLATLALAGCGHTPGTAAASATNSPHTTATPYIAPTATPVGPGLWTQVDGLTAMTLAPSNPMVAYQIGLGGVSRTTDGGGTWSAPILPVIAGYSSLIQPQSGGGAFVSPANPDTLYMIVNAFASGSCGAGAGVSQTVSGIGAPSGATVSCTNEYVSVDRGARWARLQLPAPGLITSMLASQRGASIQGEMQRQGGRLYANIVNEPIGQEHAPPAGRLVVSGDGGVTWRLADWGLASAGQGISSFAATQSGSTVFAITEPLSFKPVNMEPGPPLELWRSDDAGATWTRPGPLPGSWADDMRAAMIGGTPILYLQVFDSGGSPTIQASPWGASGSWQVAPTSGPTGPLNQYYAVLNTLPDGALLIDSNAILAWSWSAHASGWRQVFVAPDEVSDQLSRAFIIPTGGGRQQVWLQGNTDGTANMVEYTTLRK